jgi:hypothetical protein
LRGKGLDCGHHMAEEAPRELAAEILAFMREHDRKMRSDDCRAPGSIIRHLGKMRGRI